ncbi:MAG: tetratricopeptide repeat protein [Sulfurifustaceae bacterium]
MATITRTFVLLSAILVAPAGAFAMGTADVSSDSRVSDPDYAKGVEAVKAEKWDEAVSALSRALSRDEKNADIHNYLGYAERHRGNFDAAFKHYERALALNPKHRGAHEYMGEAYLLTGNLTKAEEHLTALDKLCMFSCPEYRELKEKVAEYKQKKM